MCIALCTIVTHNIAQNIADNFPLTLQTITIAPMMSISRKGDGPKASCVTWEVQIFHWEGAILVDRGAHCKVQALSVVSCAFAVSIVDSSGPKNAHVQWHSPGGANVPLWRCRHLSNNIEPSVYGGDVPCYLWTRRLTQSHIPHNTAI